MVNDTNNNENPDPECNVYAEIGWSYGLAGTRDSSAGSWLIRHRPDIDPLDAIKAATREWAMGQGRSQVEGNGWDLNWGDAVSEVPDNIFAAHGVVIVPTPMVHEHYSVDHDEVLFDLDDYED